MNTKTLLALLASAAFLAASPAGAALGSAAHPHVHTFYGTAANNVLVGLTYDDGTNEINFDHHSSVTFVGVCADLSPLITTTIPPQLIPDGDEETGYGGACLSHTSVYGSDVGTTQNVWAQNNAGATFGSPVFIACIDENGDGFCTAGVGGDQVNLCWAGPTNSGSYTFPGTSSPCAITITSTANNPFTYVLVIGSVTSVNGGISASTQLTGWISYA